MNYKLSITKEKDMLYVHVTGEDSRQASLEVFSIIVKVCEEHNCYKVLVESFLDNPLDTMDGYEHPQRFEEAGITHKHRIAWVDLNPATYDSFEFAETVLINRGYTMGKLFNSVDKAKQWLFER